MSSKIGKLTWNDNKLELNNSTTKIEDVCESINQNTLNIEQMFALNFGDIRISDVVMVQSPKTITSEKYVSEFKEICSFTQNENDLGYIFEIESGLYDRATFLQDNNLQEGILEIRDFDTDEVLKTITVGCSIINSGSMKYYSKFIIPRLDNDQYKFYFKPIFKPVVNPTVTGNSSVQYSWSLKKIERITQ